MAEKQNNSRKITIKLARSTETKIIFYLEHNASPYFQGNWNETHNTIQTQLIYPNKSEEDNIDNSKNIKEFPANLLVCLLLSFVAMYLFYLNITFAMTLCNNLLFSCVLSTFITCIIYLIIIFCYFVYFIIIPDNTLSFRSNHSAEHMICNFIEKYQRLPISIMELRKSSRFDPYCGGISALISFMKLFHCAIPILLIFGIDICVFLLKLNIISLWIKLVILLLIAGVVLIFIKKKLYLHFKKISNFIIQLCSTTNNINEDSLVLAYFVARVWMLHKYPECANEVWMQNSEFLDNFNFEEIQNN